jgi:hypothetical protein
MPERRRGPMVPSFLSVRKMFLVALLVPIAVSGADESTTTVREKLRAKLMESLPPFQPAKPPDEAKRSEVPPIFTNLPEAKKQSDSSVIVMAPVEVSESKRDRNLETAIDRQSLKEPFSTTKGGTIYNSGRVKVGGWWEAKEGWSFLKISF